MKNLFKNLMLVAVAAMAFTACTETNDEVNAVSKVTRYEFTANIAEETRSGFAGSETVDDKTFHKSSWDGGETLKLFVKDNNDYYVETTATINAEGKFTLQLENAPESFSMSVCSPAESWASEYTATIPTEQTPRANSVDPKAHILSSQGNLVSNGTASINMSLQDACYGKMTVNAPESFEIGKVEVSFNGDKVYTLNATNVENNVFWFAVDSAIEVSTFTVTAYNKEGNAAITKTVDVAAAEKTLEFKYGRVSTFSVSNLEAVVEPEGPVFTSASSDATNYDYADCYLTFEGENLGTLMLNAYHVVNDKLELPVGSYMLTDAPGNFWTAGYSTFIPAGTEDTYNLTSGTVNVSVVNDEYVIEFIDLAYGSNVLNATYTGTITGLILADPRQELPAPSNVKATVSGKTITLTWDPVEGADGYRVKLYSPHAEYFEEIVDDEEYVYEAQLSNTNYSFTIMSYASDTNAQYRSSEDEYAYATTEDTDPKMEISESTLSFTADGGEKTFTVTLKNTDAAIEYTQEGDWFTVAFSGDTFTVNASANESETDAREGSITVTAGALSQTIDVTQSKKSAQAGTDGTEANPHIFESPAQGYAWYQLVFGTATDGASLIMELASNIYLANLGVEYSLSGKGPWYSGGHTYTAPNGTVYFNDDFAANSTAIVTKNADGVQYDILFKIVAGGVTTYYKTTVPSTF